MADNIGITAGTGTVIATDDIGGFHHQRIKIVIGADNVSNGDVSSANPIPAILSAETTKVIGTVNISATSQQRVVNPTGNIINALAPGMDLGNSTSVNLGIGATFTGAFKDAAEYSNLSVLIRSNQVSAVDGFLVEYSADGVTVVDEDVYTIPALDGKQFSFPLPSQFYRIRYTNGAVATTSFVISAKLHAARPKPSSHRLSQLVSNESDAEVVKAYQQHDINRNITTYHMTLPVVTTITDTLQSLTGYKSGAAVAATTTPAVVTAGRRYRVTSIVLTYVGIITAGSAKITLRANTAGVVAIGSAAVLAYVGLAPAAVAGAGMSYTVPLPDGLEFAAGTGIGISAIGLSATSVAAASGYVQVVITGFEY